MRIITYRRQKVQSIFRAAKKQPRSFDLWLLRVASKLEYNFQILKVAEADLAEGI